MTKLSHTLKKISQSSQSDLLVRKSYEAQSQGRKCGPRSHISVSFTLSTTEGAEQRTATNGIFFGLTEMKGAYGLF